MRVNDSSLSVHFDGFFFSLLLLRESAVRVWARICCYVLVALSTAGSVPAAEEYMNVNWTPQLCLLWHRTVQLHEDLRESGLGLSRSSLLLVWDCGVRVWAHGLLQLEAYGDCQYTWMDE